MDEVEVVCRARVVPLAHTSQLAMTLATEDGQWPVGYALGTDEFRMGDLVEIRLVERCPDFGKEWAAGRGS